VAPQICIPTFHGAREEEGADRHHDEDREQHQFTMNEGRQQTGITDEAAAGDQWRTTRWATE
jgi:hypothetical protein